MKFSVIIFSFMILFSCNQKIEPDNAYRTKLRNDILTSVKRDFRYEVSNIELIRVEEYKYLGYLVLKKDGSKVSIEVFVDRDDPNLYIWELKEPNATMINDALQQNDLLNDLPK